LVLRNKEIRNGLFKESANKELGPHKEIQGPSLTGSVPFVATGVNQTNSLHHHRLQHIQYRHHLPLWLPEECVPYAWIKAAESFEQLGEMGVELWADCQQ